MENDERRTSQLIQELAGLGVNFDISDPRTNQLIHELAAEKAAQIEGAETVLKSLAVIVVILVFVACFWWYEIGLLLSIGAALVTLLVIGLGIALPIGRILGRRAARRFIVRMRDG